MKESRCCSAKVNRCKLGEETLSICSNCLLPTTTKRRFKFFKVFLFSFLLFIPITFSKPTFDKMKKFIKSDIEEPKIEKLDYGNLKNYLVKKNSRFLRVALKQAKKESDLKSELCVTHHNLFGMLYHKDDSLKIYRVPIGKDKNGKTMFASGYKNWHDSVDDYLRWIENHCGEEYLYKILGTYYCPDNGYVQSLKQIEIQ